MFQPQGYHSALDKVLEILPDPERQPSIFIQKAEEFCGLLAFIYSREYDDVCADLQELTLDEDQDD